MHLGDSRAAPVLPSLGIVVPVYNEAKAAATLLARLAALTEHQLVVIDGGSSDGTAQRLRDLGGWAELAAHMRGGGYQVVTAPRGRALQMNRGAACSQAEVLLFLHADTGLTAEHARLAQRAVQGGADFGCFALRIASSDLRLRLASCLISLRSRALPSATGDQALFMRRALFRRLGGYRELALCEDLDLVARARRHGRFVCLQPPVTTSARRWERQGVWRTIGLMWMLRLGFHAGVDPQRLGRLYQDVRG